MEALAACDEMFGASRKSIYTMPFFTSQNRPCRTTGEYARARHFRSAPVLRGRAAAAANRRPLPHDAPTDVITFADGRSAIYCRMRADVQTRTTKQSLWRTDDSGPPRPMEAGEPDAFSPQLSPDGKWILFLSTRGFSDGTPAFEPVPPYSDTAADPLTPMQFRRSAVKSEFLAGR